MNLSLQMVCKTQHYMYRTHPCHERTIFIIERKKHYKRYAEILPNTFQIKRNIIKLKRSQAIYSIR